MQYTLLEWVDGLVTNYTTPTADPDTVEDKNVKDTDDVTAFDGLLGKQ